jgi:hypothetical protein
VRLPISPYPHFASEACHQAGVHFPFDDYKRDAKVRVLFKKTGAFKN